MSTSPWLLAIRPATLSAALAPVLVGSAVAARAGGFRLGPAAAALAGALLLQIGVNLANDVDDFERGADTGARRGPTRVTQSGLLTARQVRAAEWLAFGLAALVGCYLIAVAGWPIAVLGAAAIAAAWAYTGGPWPLGYHGLGDLCVFLFFGVAAVAGTTYVQTGALERLALLAALPVGVLITAILVVNNTRDADTDRQAGKRTLAVRLGTTAARVQYALLLAVAYAVPLLLWARGVASAWVLLPLLTLPLAARRIADMAGADDAAAFNALLGGTARLQLLFGALFAAGLMR
ncbi:MAG TPA: 1,4-dihydroxy-2-naphthoate polyprenyltransferase [Candidatus Dormibacteraeota bacterium]|nr:1,4-dihydroxy-2-naphthoate polyprenyltransferase [Candidatus Dormibacteraeota bacterium]